MFSSAGAGVVALLLGLFLTRKIPFPLRREAFDAGLLLHSDSCSVPTKEATAGRGPNGGA